MSARQHGDFSQWLNITMSNAGMTGRTLAHKARVTDSAVSRWKAGETPGVEALVRLAEIFKVDVRRLLSLARPEQFGDLADPLPMPEPRQMREHAYDQIDKMTGVPRAAKEAMKQTLDRELNRYITGDNNATP
ncbi:helix-turn-helix domain-containing protein [Streptomyces sioyaensis]|uniref:helix-turn-helix domain-containing protein n=1 Tax=Streptomyces sioyaensis TaxID=67364 RepID=UPI003D734179